MRKAQSVEKVPTPAPDVETKVIPAPTDGWDAISPLSSMDPKRAPILNNFIPRPGWVELRGGYIPWTQLSQNAPVETIMVYRAESEEVMFAAIGGSIFDVSFAADATRQVLTGMNSARWQWINYTPGGGTTVLQCVNGIDSLQMFDGTNWTVPDITGLPNGLTSSAITNIHQQKRRIWYVLGDGIGGGSTIGAFMPTDAIMGPIESYLDFGALWSKGGHLIAIFDWTVDGGFGPADYLCGLSSRGEITVYSGVDPTSSTAWNLVGVFAMAPPVSHRCYYRLGSDVALINQEGIIPVSQSLPFDPSAERSVAVTARIQHAMAQATTLGKDLFGWQMISFPPEQLFILNVPQAENQQQVQFVMNVLTGAWCQFIGWNANCFEIYNDILYFGGNDGSINQCFIGAADNTTAITAEMQCAYNYFDAPGRLKRMTMVQPFISAAQTIIPQIAIDTDFTVQNQTAPETIIVGGSKWDISKWDTDVWFGQISETTSWLSTQAIGHALAVHMTVSMSSGGNAVAGIFDYTNFDQAIFDSIVSTVPMVMQVNAFNAIVEMGGFV